MNQSRRFLPRSRGGRVVLQIALLAMTAGAVYLLVLWLGSGL
ncbi:MAG TPA: hypothetical protein VM848_16705 [Acidimicrobiia bacterium]|nr:hypothetical protein [Acidimicrobiia bacterium]